MRHNLRYNSVVTMMQNGGVPTPFTDQLRSVYDKVMATREVTVPRHREPDGSVVEHVLIEPELSTEMSVTTVGAILEQWIEVLGIVSEEIEGVRDTIRVAASKVDTLDKIIRPMIANDMTLLRKSGIAMAIQIRDMLNELEAGANAELRRIERDGALARLERLSDLCQEVKKLKDDGVFDALRRAGFRQ